MTFDEATQAVVTKEEARLEILRHKVSFDDFIAECGDHEEYDGLTVLAWLGY